MYELAKLWPYSWQYTTLELGPGQDRTDIGIAEIKFVHYLTKNALHEECTLPDKEKVYAWWNGLSEMERQAQTKKLYKIDDRFYKKMVALYNENGPKQFDPVKCAALVDEWDAYMAELEKEREQMDAEEK